MLILFTKNLSLQKERGDPLSKRVKPKHVHLKTVRIPTLERHMTERGDSLLETNTENAPDSSQTRSFHESETFNVGDKSIVKEGGDPLLIMTM